ncbi:21724_t:CDS:2, partial [Racocetra persica]
NKLFMSSDDGNSDTQYLVTFEHDNYGKLIINYELVEVANDNEQEFNEQDCVNIELDIESKKGKGKGKLINKEKSKNNEEAQTSNINTDIVLPVLE